MIFIKVTSEYRNTLYLGECREEPLPRLPGVARVRAGRWVKYPCWLEARHCAPTPARGEHFELDVTVAVRRHTRAYSPRTLRSQRLALSYRG